MKTSEKEPEALVDKETWQLIADLPQPHPPASVRENFYQTLADKQENLLFMRLAGATAVLSLLLLLFAVPFALLNRQIPSASSGQEVQPTRLVPTRTPNFTPTPLIVGSAVPFNQLKLKLMRFSTDGVPLDPEELLPVMREDFSSYIQSLPEGFATLENGVEFFNLQSLLSPYAPNQLILHLEDVDNDGQRELLVGILPPVLIIEPDESGDVQITELPWPELLPAVGSFPSRIDTGDFDDNGRPDIRIVYSHLDYPDRENETIVVTYDGQQWLK